MRSVVAVLLALALPASAHAAPVLGPETPRGTGTLQRLADRAPAPKTVDGLTTDWIGSGPGFAGTVVRSAGELIYTDHLFDAWGADDGRDAEALATMQPLQDGLPETYRLEAILRNDPAGQVGAPWPEQLEFKDHYGDLERSDRTDLTELRLAADASGLHVLARTAGMEGPGDAALLLLLDTEPGGAEHEVGFGTGLRTGRAELAAFVTGSGGTLRDLRTGAESPVPAAAGPQGYDNAIEARLPRTGDRVAVAAALARPDGTVANVAFRTGEPVREWFDKQQALALHEGSIDRFATEVDLRALEAGATERWTPGPGYHERVFGSSEAISRETGLEGIRQHYGVYLPAAHEPRRAAPLQLWLHWRGGTAHSAGHTIPGMFEELGERHDTIVVSPRGRGTSSWYVGRGHVDVEEVWADVHATFAIDERRRYVAGHSMGGWGSFLMTVTHPDWFAAALPASPPVTQGAWTGIDFDGCDELEYDGNTPCYISANGGEPRAQHTRKLLDNLRHVPIEIYHGAADELVPVTGVTRQVERLVELGYRHRYSLFPAQEHFGPPVWDEWRRGADYMHGFAAPRDPARVTFVRDMPFERATERVNSGGLELSFSFDAAYWMSGLEPVDGQDGRARFDGRSLAIPEPPHLTTPYADAPAGAGQTGPFVRTGLDWTADPLAAPAPAANAFQATLEGARAVRLDGNRMGLDSGRAITGTISTQAPLALTLSGAWKGRPIVTAGGVPVTSAYEERTLTLALPAGNTALTITPRRPGALH